MVLISGCYPDKIDYVDEYDMAGTMYDHAAIFSSYTTFHVLDTVMHITEDGEDDPNLTRQFDDDILQLVRQNMSGKGYIEMTNPDSLNRPDLEILVQAMTDFYTYFSYWYDYWSWYPGWIWWYPGYPWYPSYPWYPGGGYYSSYTTGTLIIELLDTEVVPDQGEHPGVVWMGLVNGLLNNNVSSAKSRIEKQVNQLFKQSPYLQQ